MKIRLLVLAVTIGLVIADSWVYFIAPAPDFSYLIEDANRGSEIPADDNDPFLTDLLVKYFGWHSLSAHSVQHAWAAGFYHHVERFVIHLSPEEFADLKAHIDSTMKDRPQESFGKPSLGPDSSRADQFKWWNPPNKNAFLVPVGGIPDQAGEIIGDYIFEYDPETQLLYIDATTV